MTKAFTFLVFILFCFNCEASKNEIAQSSDSIYPKMVWVEGGQMQLGCTNEQGSNCFENEKPAHFVTISDFYMGQFEITNSEFCHFLNDYKDSLSIIYPDKNSTYKFPVRAFWHSFYNGYNLIVEDFYVGIQLPTEGEDAKYKPYPGYENHPVMMVSFLGALKFTEWLSKKSGNFYRLPTEAEWEYAARGGQLSNCQKDSCYKYSGSNDRYKVVASHMTKKVGTLQPNELGIHDMSGNVYEWVLDVYDKDYYKILQHNELNPYRGYQGKPFVGYEIKLNDQKISTETSSNPGDFSQPQVSRKIIDVDAKELERVIRGGGQVEDPTSWRVSYRDHSMGAKHTIGFRVLMVPKRDLFNQN